GKRRRSRRAGWRSWRRPRSSASAGWRWFRLRSAKPAWVPASKGGAVGLFDQQRPTVRVRCFHRETTREGHGNVWKSTGGVLARSDQAFKRGNPPVRGGARLALSLAIKRENLLSENGEAGSATGSPPGGRFDQRADKAVIEFVDQPPSLLVAHR